MQDKLLAVGAYLTVGTYIVFLLGRNLWRSRETPTLDSHRWRFGACAGVAALVFVAFASPPVGWLVMGLASLSALACGFRPSGGERRFDWVSTSILLAVFCIAVGLAWWRRNGPAADISWRELLVVQLVAATGTRLFLRQESGDQGGGLAWCVAPVVTLLATVVSLFSTGLYDNDWMRWLAWHHWGAYVGPAQLALQGIPVLHDLPLQYGLGPTAVVALACGKNCWYSMYFLVGGLTLLYVLLLALIALRIAGVRRVSRQFALIVTVIFLATMVWTAYPAQIGSPAATPSVAGLRFLPTILLLFALVKRPGDTREDAPTPVLNLLWLLGVLWSPESAFQVTVVWWPYHVWTSTQNGSSQVSRFSLFLRANVRLCAWLVAGVMVFLTCYWSVYRILPSCQAYLAYVEHPPGAIPIKPFGAIWFFGSALAVGILGLQYRSRDPATERQNQNLAAVLLATYGASSYFLGRSHDNNLLNISVFFVLLLLAVRTLPQPRVLRVAASGMLACLIAYAVLGNWSTWGEILKDGGFAKFEPASTVASFSYVHPAGMRATQVMMAGAPSSQAFAEDAAWGMRTIYERYGEPVVVLDPSLSPEEGVAGTAWSAFNGPENYVYLPSPIRRRFLAAVAARLQATGWVLVNRNYPAEDWIADFDEVYRRDRTMDFGTYYAIRYIPRPG
jgi:hypothetical protein